MPVSTPHFGLQAFVRGDIYSSLIDRRRFSIIDQHFNFIANLIGDGKMDGWYVSSNGGLKITATEGIGIIGGFVTRTFQDFSQTLVDGKKFKIYFRRRNEVIGTPSAFSDMSIIVHVDSVAPAVPISLSVNSTNSNSFNISWIAVIDFDLDVYDIYLSTNNIDFSVIDSVTSNSFTVIGLDENTTYFTKIKSKDFSGNSSPFSSTLSVTTDVDKTIPPDPVDVNIFDGDSKIQISYLPPIFNRIGGFVAYVTPINGITSQPIGSTVSSSVGSLNLNIPINNLSNFQRYSVVVKTVSLSGIESDGVVILAFPQKLLGPDEVEGVVISDRNSDNEVSDVVIDISWTLDPYNVDLPESFEIIIVEAGDEGTIQSQPIKVLGSTKSLQLFPILQDDGTIIFRAVRPRTRYYISIRSVDTDGNKSPGVFRIFNTRAFEKPIAPSLFIVSQRSDQSLFLEWNNSSSIFSSNLLSINRISDSGDITIIENEKNINRSDFFSVSESLVKTKTTFMLSVLAVDEFGNRSEKLTSTFFVPDSSSIARPPEPEQQIGFAGDRRSSLQWNKPETGIVAGYRIYRSASKAFYKNTDFAIVETIDDPEQLTYDDFEVVNGKTYVYFVTTIDIFDRESLNPIQDEFMGYKFINLTPNPASELAFPENVTLSKTGVDITVSWDASVGQFDGYEIFRSIRNKFSFEKIATTAASVNTYVDTNAAIKTATYFYIVRKSINEADLFITESVVTPSGALLIADVTTSNGVATINTSSVRVVENLETVIKTEIESQVSVHKHRVFREFGVERDRRINLSNSIKVDDWVPDSIFQKYITITGISNATTFTVFINGEISSIISTLDVDRGVLTFEEPLTPGNAVDPYSEDIGEFPFSSPPIIEVVFDNLSETKNEFPKERLLGIHGSQISTGRVGKGFLPPISHNGRLKEKIIPLQIPTKNVSEGYVFRPFFPGELINFKLENDINYHFIGSAVAFYDVQQSRNPDGTLSNFLISVSSDGFLTSKDFGLNWKRRLHFSTPGHKIFYSESFRSYFVLTNRGIMFSKGISERQVKEPDTGKLITEQFIDFSRWSEMSGTETAKIVRDIIQTPNNSMFVSSDLGMYKLLFNDSKTVFFWQQVPIFGPESTDMYALLYDDTRDRVIVSNELGIFETFNDGVLWEFSDEFPDQRPIFDFYKQDTTIFAVTNNIVWRRRIDQLVFTRIAELDVNSIRKVTMWDSRLFVQTSDGLLVSKKDSDPINDGSVVFELAFPQINTGKSLVITTSVNQIEDKLFVGTEKRLFCANSIGDVSIQAEISEGIAPTIFVNNVEQVIGVRFSTASSTTYKVVSFDEKLPINSVVTIANQYKKYKAVNGGWADGKFDSNVILYLDGIRTNNGSISESAVRSILPPVPDTNVGNIPVKDKIFTNIDTLSIARDELLGTEDDEGNVIIEGANSKVSKEYTDENVRNMFKAAERTISQVYWKIDELGDRLLTIDFIMPNEEFPDGKFVEEYYNNPKFRVALLRSPDEEITLSDIGITSFGKYGDQKGTGGQFGSEFSENN